MTRAIGVDGARGGWVAVELVDGRCTDARLVADLAAVAAWAGRAPVGVDIPIGMVDNPRRTADVAARQQLSGAGASVFPAPCRAVVDAYRAGSVTAHAEASELSRRVTGAGLSRQSWNLLGKIAEADELVDRGVDLREVHPELSFRLRAGRPLASKRTWAGLRARVDLLRAAGVVVPARFEGADRVAPDDVVDAAIVAWTVAGPHGHGGLRSHPQPPTQWDRGRPVVIWTRP